ncbi:PEP phosphonomutase [Streptomyces formicae]|uniref:4-hydroxy-tetrahydrodipicolinate synthase n=1 Tax=Streptomyces formicae TaxID=1616117 RepID=A0A291Q9B3_9ACTN|nr:PEP phosphonomutase [Streptomyces formicae]ATL28063.1 4-hydroxy-tetrahydrodipicolinate synthase [Streptomyces formicae]
MTTRILDLDRERLAALRGRELTASVAAAEGRTMVAEVFADRAALIPMPGMPGVHNAELVASFGADIVVLNLIERAWDGEQLDLPGLGTFASIADLAAYIGRPVGINLEPGDVPEIRRAKPEYAKRLIDMGAAMLCLTANPGTGGSYEGLARVTEELRAGLGDDVALWSGKMHHAGHPERVTVERLTGLVDAGADGVVMPLPGTLPGVTKELAAAAVAAVQDAGAVVMGAIGTSQEGSHANVVPQLALTAKEVGIDAHHFGDSFLPGMCDPEVMYDYSVAIRGRRHTWNRMALGGRGYRRTATA